MMPVEWPPAALAADRPVDAARPREGRGRLPTVLADFFLDESARLTDEERALMAAMLRNLITHLADEIIANLPGLVAAEAERALEGINRRLRVSRLLEREDVIALLLRRADEQQLSAVPVMAGSTLAELVGDEDSGVAEAAMTLTLARGRRRDRYGRLEIEFDDLAAEDAVALVFAVAAALRDGLDASADPHLTAAARALLSRHDEGRRLESAVAGLARALHAAGRGDDKIVRKLAEDGDAALLVGVLSRRAGVDYVDGWNLFTSRDMMMLARLADCDRPTAAQILASFDRANHQSAERLIDRYDALAQPKVDDCRRWLRLDLSYRLAREALEHPHG
ncbi:hypothetical protein [Sphingomonas xanthus]|uniref:DUF2336 domain-containing protein n=1 Tax=Sphingomonas xanthus TaxID=2594473 RepID=A0A516ITX7_9SPHN|nr:hypothetical protein [Sphingomonas xanthus]QDP20320.1 hypothetical protein FMM02_10375 [Sphingomonas xanthus]